jgi:hypothetical protein
VSLHNFLHTLINSNGVESMTPHLIWGELELTELKTFIQKHGFIINKDEYNSEEIKNEDNVTWKKVVYSRLSKELVVGDVYISAFLQQSLHPHTRTNSRVRNSTADSTHSRGDSNTSNSSSSSSSKAAVVSQLRDPKIFLKALIRRLYMEAGQTIKGRAVKTKAKVAEETTQTDTATTMRTTASSLKTVGMALRQLISSVVKRNNEEENNSSKTFNSTLSSTGGIIEYDDVRKFVQLIRRLAQQRLMPLRSEMDVSLQRSSTTGKRSKRV